MKSMGYHKTWRREMKYGDDDVGEGAWRKQVPQSWWSSMGPIVWSPTLHITPSVSFHLNRSSDTLYTYLAILCRVIGIWKTIIACDSVCFPTTPLASPPLSSRKQAGVSHSWEKKETAPRCAFVPDFNFSSFAKSNMKSFLQIIHSRITFEKIRIRVRDTKLWSFLKHWSCHWLIVHLFCAHCKFPR